MQRYQIWNKQDPVYTPGGPVYTPEEWMDKYQWMKHPKAVPVLEAGLMNGGSVGELGEMKRRAELQGAVFDQGLSNQELLEAIEAFEDEMNQPADPADLPPTVEERTAAALEFIAMNSLPDAGSI